MSPSVLPAAFTVADFDFFLPPELIAQHPAAERTGSRLLQVLPDSLVDRQFSALPSLLNPGDLLVFNNTKVIKARFFGRKESGGQVEVLLERITEPRHAVAQIRASKSPKPGTRLDLAAGASMIVTGRAGDFFTLTLPETETRDFWQLAETYGNLPLPPYITHTPEAVDESRYQTVYAQHPGAVAAPTAGLHFDENLLATLRQQGIQTAELTLHVGAGTYQPVRVEAISEHKMHSERFEIPAATVTAIQATQAAGNKVIAVGTTSLRALESAARATGEVQGGAAETDIFITPGFQFRVVDQLITNFHLPKSTLLMLVSAFAGYARMQAVYRHAVAAQYRFFSYGDAMLLTRT